MLAMNQYRAATLRLADAAQYLDDIGVIDTISAQRQVYLMNARITQPLLVAALIEVDHRGDAERLQLRPVPRRWQCAAVQIRRHAIQVDAGVQWLCPAGWAHALQGRRRCRRAPRHAQGQRQQRTEENHGGQRQAQALLESVHRQVSPQTT
ncbi:hypothetical protein UYA_11005 [Ectopseudomonas alcaliphila JAB1]|nr:hypothetical protein UYA_11005 [Pseudomonas alcaliphila JAB1]